MSANGLEKAGGAMPPEPVERVRVILERVVEALDLDASVEVTEDAGEIHGSIEGEDVGLFEDVGLLIGRHGQTIDAVQLLCYRAAFQGVSERKRVSVDAGGYRARQAETLHREADLAAQRAAKVKRPMTLSPMSASERRVVHERLKDVPGIETYSEGEEPERCVVIAPLLQ